MAKTLRPYQQKAVDDTWEILPVSNDPILLVMSVGSGKTLVISDFLSDFEELGYRSLNLSMSSELIEQNAEEYRDYYGRCSVMCSKLGRSEYKLPSMFATPQSLWSAIKKDHPVASKHIDVIVVDEAHNINFNNPDTVYMKIFNHYLELNPKLKIIGLTGTPYRGKGIPIYGDDKFFKHKTADVSTTWLIDNGFLVPPVFGTTAQDGYDFDDLQIQSNGKFKGSDLAERSEGKTRLTHKIVQDILMRTRNRGGSTIIFASTAKHCEEIMQSLPSGKSAMVLGTTPDAQRYDIVKKVKSGEIQFVVNVGVLVTGFNAPIIRNVAFLRPTESIIFWLQAMGRGLRLDEENGKEDCLILDYSGNLERLGDGDNVLLAKAIIQSSEVERDVPCPACETLNTVNARRCIGMIKDESDLFDGGTGMRRCDFFFSFVLCEHCETKNVSGQKYCRMCDAELVDPNDNLVSTPAMRIGVKPVTIPVISMQLTRHRKKGKPDSLKAELYLDTKIKAHQFINLWWHPESDSPRLRSQYIKHFARRFFPGIPEAENATINEILEHRKSMRKPVSVMVNKKVGSQYLSVVQLNCEEE